MVCCTCAGGNICPTFDDRFQLCLHPLGKRLAAAFWLQVAGDGHCVLLSGSPLCLRIDEYFFKSLQS